MTRAAGFASLAVLLLATACSAQINTNVRSRGPAPTVKFLSNTNGSDYSTFWTAIEAAHLDDYLNTTGSSLTIFAPTNAAWEKRLPSLTRPYGITVQDLFSDAKSNVMENIVKYHFLQDAFTNSMLTQSTHVSTLTNLCSNAKMLKVHADDNGNVALVSIGGTTANVLDRGTKLGRSVVYAIDDVLLPQVVTIPLTVALSTFSSGNDKLNRRVQAAAGGLAKVSNDVQSLPLAPMAAAGMALAPPASDSPDGNSDGGSASADQPASGGNAGTADAGGAADGGGVATGDSSTDGSRRRLLFAAGY